MIEYRMSDNNVFDILHKPTLQDEEFDNAVNKFYELKNEYDTSIKDAKARITNKTHLSDKEKRDEFRKLRIRCVNCKRNVKTIFQIRLDNEKENRVAKAMCGDRVNPCPLNIEINLGRTTTIANEVNRLHKSIADIKQKIVIIKNNLLFGYTTPDEAVGKFNELKEDLEFETESYEYMLAAYTNIYEHKRSEDRLLNMEKRIYEHINSIKTMIVDYNKENNHQYITDAVTLFVSQLQPLVEDFRKLKYPVCFTTKVGNDCRLVQERETFRKYEFDTYDRDVVSFTTGTNRRNSSSNRSEE